MALSYYEQLQHPLWIKKKQEILNRDGRSCRVCGSELHKLDVHHLCYLPDLLLWEYDDELMITVCKKHHEQLTYDLPKVAGLIAFNCLINGIDLSLLNEILITLKKTINGTR